MKERGVKHLVVVRNLKLKNQLIQNEASMKKRKKKERRVVKK